ncbi:MAG: hypothetical protein P0S95_01085 [Rhabdochlamydiaceae bacterium]|nr:hypothetical protein [Candidatus Amphrikana amoebophyrae]
MAFSTVGSATPYYVVDEMSIVDSATSYGDDMSTVGSAVSYRGGDFAAGGARVCAIEKAAQRLGIREINGRFYEILIIGGDPTTKLDAAAKAQTLFATEAMVRKAQSELTVAVEQFSMDSSGEVTVNNCEFHTISKKHEWKDLTFTETDIAQYAGAAQVKKGTSFNNFQKSVFTQVLGTTLPETMERDDASYFSSASEIHIERDEGTEPYQPLFGPKETWTNPKRELKHRPPTPLSVSSSSMEGSTGASSVGSRSSRGTADSGVSDLSEESLSAHTRKTLSDPDPREQLLRSTPLPLVSRSPRMPATSSRRPEPSPARPLSVHSLSSSSGRSSAASDPILVPRATTTPPRAVGRSSRETVEEMLARQTKDLDRMSLEELKVTMRNVFNLYEAHARAIILANNNGPLTLYTVDHEILNIGYNIKYAEHLLKKYAEKEYFNSVAVTNDMAMTIFGDPRFN